MKHYLFKALKLSSLSYKDLSDVKLESYFENRSKN